MIETEFGTLNKFPLSEAVGRTIICDDGIPRKVVNICFSYRYKHRAIVNETDPEAESGHWVHLLSLACQIEGKPLPTEEQKQAFTRMTRALDWEQQDSRFRVTKSGLMVPNKLGE